VRYYEQFSPKLGQQFLQRLKEANHFLATMPKGFQKKYKAVRTLLLKLFPYHMHYFIDDKNQTIIVLAIIHSYRNPKDYTLRF
jgi:plasmid stabilization system protein ParE